MIFREGEYYRLKPECHYMWRDRVFRAVNVITPGMDFWLDRSARECVDSADRGSIGTVTARFQDQYEDNDRFSYTPEVMELFDLVSYADTSGVRELYNIEGLTI